jgi:uncharacterized coiled-coil protein SlyX
MDLAVNTRVELEALKATAPRSFDRSLIDLLVAIQHGHQPIVTAFPAPVMQPGASYNDAELRGMIASQQGHIEQLSAALAEASRAYASLMDICRRLDERIDGVSVQLRQVA